MLIPTKNKVACFHNRKAYDSNLALSWSDPYDGYFRKEKPYLDKITYVMVPDRAAAALAMQRGDIQYAAFSTLRIAEVDRLASNPNLTVTKAGYEGVGSISWLAFNMREGPLANVKVRQAISYAVDRDFISLKLHHGRSQPAWGPIHPASPFYSKALEPYKVDLARANRLLDEAGFPRKADGNRFSLRLDFVPGWPDMSQLVAEYMRPQLAKVGIQVQLRPSPDFPTWSQRISNWDFDMNIDGVYNWGDPAIGVGRTYLSSNIRKGVIWSNTQGYANPEVDKILTEAAAEADSAKRAMLYERFQKIVNSELPVAWLNSGLSVTIASKRLHGLPKSIWGAFAPFDEVYLSK